MNSWSQSIYCSPLSSYRYPDKIIVGNFQGLIRIYEPHPPHYNESHMLLEKQLSSPVLQVAAGKFVEYV